MSNCGTTHYEGCECNEARWQERLSVERNEVLRLREELKLSEGRRAELVRALEKINTCEITVADFKAMPLKLAFIKMAETVSREALASQSRPKILDVMEKIEDIAGQWALSVDSSGYMKQVAHVISATEKE